MLGLMRRNFKEDVVSKHVTLSVAAFAGLILISACGRRTTGPNPSPIYEAAYQRYLAEGPEREKIRAENRRIVRQCAETVAPETKIRASGVAKSLCNYPDTYLGSLVNYLIQPAAQGFHISLQIGLVMQPFNISSSRAKENLQTVRACIPAIQEVYKRYDLDLDLRIDERKFYEIDSATVVRVDLIDGKGRSNSGHWYIQDEPICLILLHEVSHLFGLDDEYEDDCPARKFISREINPVSIMNSTYRGFPFIDLYPRHIRDIIHPMCKNEEGSIEGVTYTAEY
jgi:hypothetical protein